jgi:hypothetical protein
MRYIPPAWSNQNSVFVTSTVGSKYVYFVSDDCFKQIATGYTDLPFL